MILGVNRDRLGGRNPWIRPHHPRRFLRRLSALQEVLGLANDAAVARALVAPLGTVPSLRWAVGVAEGWAAARTIGIRGDVIAAWSRLSGIDPFWPEA